MERFSNADDDADGGGGGGGGGVGWEILSSMRRSISSSRLFKKVELDVGSR